MKVDTQQRLQIQVKVKLHLLVRGSEARAPLPSLLPSMSQTSRVYCGLRDVGVQSHVWVLESS